MLLMSLLMMGAGSAWADADVTYNVADPSWTVSNGVLSDGTDSFTGAGPDNFKKNSGYFMMGKSGAYIDFPVYDSAVEKIVVTGNSGASASTKMNIYVGDVAVSTETEGSKETNTYEIASGYQAAGTQYRLKVTSNHNAQITKIEVYFAQSSLTPVATIGDLSATTLNIGAEGQFTVSVTPADAALAEGEDYELTWSSSNDDILTVLADGTYEAVAKGTAVVTATVTALDGDTYSDATKKFTIAVVDPNANDGSAAKPFTVAEAIAEIEGGNTGTLYVKGIVSEVKSLNTSDGTVTYYISDDGTTTTQLQVYHGKNLNDTQFTSLDEIAVGDEVTVVGPFYYYKGTTPEINSGSYITATTHVQKADAAFAFAQESYSCDLLKAFAAPVLSTAEGYDGTVSYSSSVPAVATVDEATGAVTLLAAGTTVITASAAATDLFKAGSASYTLTVTVNPGVDPLSPAAAGSKYVKVTSTSDITSGQYLIVYEAGDVAFNGGLDPLDAVSNTIDVTIENGEIAATTATQAAEFTIDTEAGSLLSASGKYAGVTSYSNGLVSSEDVIENAFSIDEEGNAVITVTTSGGDMTLRFNSASNQNRFRYYKSGQQAIQLYKYVAGTPSDAMTVTLSAYGYKTLVSTTAFTCPEGTTAYMVSKVEDGEAVLSALDVVPAGEPVILKGEASAEVSLTIADAEGSADGNLLLVSDATTADGAYVLAEKSGEVGFYRWTGGSLGKGRVYLPASAVQGAARGFLTFSFAGTAAIEAVAVPATSTAAYDLTGRRVEQPAKGIYVIGGKKVVVK